MAEEVIALQTRIRQLKLAFESGEIPRLVQHEVNPNLDKSERLNYLYFTLPVSINFQRSSPAMWKAALATYLDPETNYLFYPEQVIKTDFAKLQADLLKHRLSLQRNKHTQIWQKIATTLYEQYDSDPRRVMQAGQNCVVRIKRLIQETNRDSFPYLRGAKMANYWLYILHQYTDIKLRNLHKITIIPDTHVLQSTVQLGMAATILTPDQAAKVWEKALVDTGILPLEMHAVLWNWSRAGFKPQV